ncbi:MAG: hypothetical protein O7F71_19865 [Gammaproteobacteria bacterium]|nr:hypothetical protein [Gammaproteobacteria bacterium]
MNGFALATFTALSAIGLVSCSQEPASSQSLQVQARTSAQPAEPPDGEHLLAQPPQGWVQGFVTKTPTLSMVEYVPENPGDGDWVDKVSFESFSADELPDPIEFVMDIATDQAAACENFEHFNILTAEENGYPTSVRFMNCPENNLIGMGQVTLIKAIQGNDRFYVITRARRVPLAEEVEKTTPISNAEMALWSAYMRAIGVCDAERGDIHPCPELATHIEEQN